MPQTSSLRLTGLGDSHSADLVSYNAAIRACEGEQWAWALQLMEEMNSRALRKDVITFNAGMSACECFGRGYIYIYIYIWKQMRWHRMRQTNLFHTLIDLSVKSFEIFAEGAEGILETCLAVLGGLNLA